MIAVVVAVVCAVVLLVARWRRVGGRHGYRAGTEWRYWIMSGSMVGLALAYAAFGQVAFYALSPLVLIPLGLYGLSSSTPRDPRSAAVRRIAWSLIISGLLAAMAVGWSLVSRRPGPLP